MIDASTLSTGPKQMVLARIVQSTNREGRHGDSTAFVERGAYEKVLTMVTTEEDKAAVQKDNYFRNVYRHPIGFVFDPPDQISHILVDQVGTLKVRSLVSNYHLRFERYDGDAIGQINKRIKRLRL